jgi:hypothetical protein
MAYICKQCDKKYSSYKSLWFHNYKYHKMKNVVVLEKPVVVCSKNVVVPEKIIIEDNRVCSYCEKILCDRMYRWKHEKICKVRILKEEKENEKKEIVEIKKQLKEQADIIEEMKKNMKKADNKITNNNNNGIINNNHIHINALGSENILNKLSLQEQINIATCHLFNESPHVEMVRLTYTKENCIENQNTLITNLQNKSCQVFNNKTGKFEATNKSQHIDNIIHYRKKDVEELSETLKNNKKVYKKYGKKLDPVEPINLEKDKEEITYIIYNNRDKVKEIKKQLDNGELEYVEDEESENLEYENLEDVVEEPPVQNIVL